MFKFSSLLLKILINNTIIIIIGKIDKQAINNNIINGLKNIII